MGAWKAGTTDEQRWILARRLEFFTGLFGSHTLITSADCSGHDSFVRAHATLLLPYLKNMIRRARNTIRCNVTALAMIPVSIFFLLRKAMIPVGSKRKYNFFLCAWVFCDF